MPRNLKICYRAGVGEILEKKSRFIATVASVKTEEEASSFIEKVKKDNWSARHNCYAYIVGEDANIYKYSDDGEPSGTAGRSMLDILVSENVTNICVVVTRYFGGVLLGTGGLVRAYSDAIKEGLKNSKLLERKEGALFSLDIDYTLFGKLKYFIEESGYFILNTNYTSNVYLRVLVPKEDEEKFIKATGNITLGKIELSKAKPCTYLLDDKKLILDNIAET